MNAAGNNLDVRTLLMVDDDDAFRIAMKQALSAGGKYRVRSADSGEAAIEALQHYRFDVILLDYRMPGISGLNVLQAFRPSIETPAHWPSYRPIRGTATHRCCRLVVSCG